MDVLNMQKVEPLMAATTPGVVVCARCGEKTAHLVLVFVRSTGDVVWEGMTCQCRKVN